VRLVTFGISNVAPSASVVAGLLIVLLYAGFAAPLVVVFAFVASLCCAVSIAEFARRLPSAGSLYTYNSVGLGRVGGFLTGWMTLFAYVLYVPAVLALTCAYLAQLLADEAHVNIDTTALFVIILMAVAVVAYIGIRTSASVDLVLVASEMAVIGALAITVLVKAAPSHFSIDAFSPRSSPSGQLREIANAMIFGVTAFAGFDAVASLGEEARKPRRTIPAALITVVVVTGAFYLLVVLAEVFGVGRGGIDGLVSQVNPLGYLTALYWSPSAVWLIELVVVLTGLGFATAAFNVAIRMLFAMGRECVLPVSLSRLSRRRTPAVAIGCVAIVSVLLGLPLTHAYGGIRAFGYLARCAGLAVVLIYLAVNVSVIRAFRTEFRDGFRFVRHLLVPAAAAVLFLFPLWGFVHPRTHQLANLLPIVAVAWLVIGAVVAAGLRSRRPDRFDALGRVFVPGDSG
jgi:amino acid transporter